MGETETKINQCGNKQAGSHKTIYITSICQKSIRKFTHRIRKEQHRTDYSEFRFRKDSLVYNTVSLLHSSSTGRHNTYRTRKLPKER